VTGRLGSAALVAREAGRIALDRLGPGRSSVPATVADVTPPWLTTTLRLGAQVDVADLLDEDAGTTTRVRVGLHWNKAADGLPSSVFVKIAPRPFKTRLFANLMALGDREVRFYRQIRPDVPVRTPAVYGVESEPRRGRFALVLEDLAAGEAQFDDIRRACTPDQAEAVVVALGQLHAAFWESRRFTSDLAWVGSHRTDPAAPLVDALVRRSVRQVEATFPQLLPAEVRRLGPTIAARRPEVDALLARAPLTLQHGDTHRGNLWFDDGVPGFFDWQVARCGPGVRDVSYFLVTSMATDEREAHQRDLVRSYVQSLKTSGAPDIAFEAVYASYRLHAVEPWIASTVTAAFGGLQAAEIAAVGLRRSVAAVCELGTFESLRRLLV
jgi:aminoglycoside phosphotransferase (APT) family kinase protein